VVSTVHAMPDLVPLPREVGRLLLAHLPALAIAAAVVTVVVLGLGEWWARRRHARDLAGAQRVRILPGPRVDPAGAIAFWQHLLGLLPHRWAHRRAGHVVFEYTFTSDGLDLSVWLPASVPAGLVAAAARSAWPGSRTTTEPAEPAAPAHTATAATLTGAGTGALPPSVAGGVLRLARPPALPIRTDHTADPLRALIGAVGPLRLGHTAVVQILARPLAGPRFAAATRARGGAGGPLRAVAWLAQLVAVGLAALVQEVAQLAVQGPGHRAQLGRSPYNHSPYARLEHRPGEFHDPWKGAGLRVARRVTSARDRAAAIKSDGSGGGYRTLIRYLATTTPTDPSPDATRTAQHAARGRAHAVASTFAEFSGHNHYRRRPFRRPLRTIERRRLRRGDALSIAELAALAHLPTDEHVPGLRRAGAAAIAPPPQIPSAGPGVRPLGDSDAIPGRPVGVSIADARHHLWIIGATGAGKSTLLVHGVLADATAGRAAVVLDPKGDLITDIYARLPEHARARTVLIDPDQPGADGRWPCLNPLDPPRSAPDQTNAGGDAAVEHVVSVFARVFSAAWGHRSEDLLRVACLTLRAQRGADVGAVSLADLPALLTDSNVRRRAAAGLRPDSPLRQFWDWFDQLPDGARAQVAAPLLNKLRAILLRPFAAQLLCGRSTVDLAQMLDHGGLLLVRLPKGVLGADLKATS
jgi:hypothetical protein